MSKYIDKDTKCALCGNSSRQHILVSMSYSDSGLDQRPYSKDVYSKILQCPVCGYSSLDIERPLSKTEMEVFLAPQHKKFLQQLPNDETGIRLSSAAYVSSRAGNDNASFLWLLSSWYWYDAEMKDYAEASRKEAICSLETEISVRQDFTKAIVLMDCYRQLSMWDDAEAGIDVLLPFFKGTEPEHKVLDYERRLISRHDPLPHSISEAAE